MNKLRNPGQKTGIEEASVPEEKKTKKKMRRCWKAILWIVGIIFLIAVGCCAGFFYLRWQGEKNLKTETVVSEDSSSKKKEDAKEGIFISYKGKEYQYNSDIVNFLCLGIDKDLSIEEKRDTGSEGLADVIMLVSVDTKSGTSKVTAIPRETIVPVRVQDKAGKFLKTEKKQITLQYAYGKNAKESCSLMQEAVSNLLYQLPVQRYCSINFQAFPVLNDAIGGVDLTALETVEWWNGAFYEGEKLHLEGQAALDYVRQRDETVPESSMGRLERQKQYINCYLEQAKAAVSQDMTLPVKMLQGLADNMCTNITASDITYLVPKLLNVSLTDKDIRMLPGETVTTEKYDEFHVNEEEVKDMIVTTFYKEVKTEKAEKEQK